MHTVPHFVLLGGYPWGIWKLACSKSDIFTEPLHGQGEYSKLYMDKII